MLILATGHLEHTQPHRIVIRYRRRHTWPRIVPRLHLLPHRHTDGLVITVHTQGEWETGRVLLQATGRYVVGRGVWRVEWVCAYLDAVLWIGTGMRIHIQWQEYGRSTEEMLDG
jgi:hypothetical protein